MKLSELMSALEKAASMEPTPQEDRLEYERLVPEVRTLFVYKNWLQYIDDLCTAIVECHLLHKECELRLVCRLDPYGAERFLISMQHKVDNVIKIRGLLKQARTSIKATDECILLEDLEVVLDEKHLLLLDYNKIVEAWERRYPDIEFDDF